MPNMTKDELRARYEEGATIMDLHLDSGYSMPTVRKYLLEVGTTMRPKGQRPGTVHQNKSNAAAKPKSSITKVVMPRAERGLRRRGYM